MPIETQLNGRIATLLDRMNPRWTALGENKGAFQGNQKQPDMLIAYRWGGQPVVIENEYVPARDVEAESLARLGETLNTRCSRPFRRDQRRHRAQVAPENCGMPLGADYVDSTAAWRHRAGIRPVHRHRHWRRELRPVSSAGLHCG